MSKILKITILIFLVLGIFQKYQEPIASKFLMLSPYLENARQRLGFIPSACKEPMPYVIGNFDSEFGISKAQFLSAIAEAEKIWEEPFGREFFYYDEGNIYPTTLKVHLVYDYRQEATKQIKNLEEQVNDNRSTYDSIKIKIDRMKIELEDLKNDYENSVKSFEIAESAYEKEVEYWNSRGGAPESEYKKLQSQQQSLERQSRELNEKARVINSKVNDINSLVVVLNNLARKLNLSVDEYNTIGASRGESFEEGVYTSDGINKQIEIYEFSNRTKLIRVLAHELGHALGLDHVSDPKSIMYRLNEGTSSSLSSDDKEALALKCQFK